MGQQPEHVCEHQACGDHGNQRCLMLRHRLSPRGSAFCRSVAQRFRSLTAFFAGIDTQDKDCSNRSSSMLIRRQGLIGAAALAWAGTARADAYPSKQIRWVIPFAPGGNYDVTSRLVGEPMGRQLGQSVLIDNKPGA